MARVRVSTTVDEALLAEARSARSGVQDSVLLDEALRALVAENRRSEIDASYTAYDDHPIDSADEWGDLATWARAAGNT
jgi:hypothetical protein